MVKEENTNIEIPDYSADALMAEMRKNVDEERHNSPVVTRNTNNIAAAQSSEPVSIFSIEKRLIPKFDDRDWTFAGFYGTADLASGAVESRGDIEFNAKLHITRRSDVNIVDVDFGVADSPNFDSFWALLEDSIALQQDLDEDEDTEMVFVLSATTENKDDPGVQDTFTFYLPLIWTPYFPDPHKEPTGIRFVSLRNDIEYIPFRANLNKIADAAAAKMDSETAGYIAEANKINQEIQEITSEFSAENQGIANTYSSFGEHEENRYDDPSAEKYGYLTRRKY